MADRVIEQAQTENISNNIPFYVQGSVQYHDGMDQSVFCDDQEPHYQNGEQPLSEIGHEDVVQSVTVVPLTLSGLQDLAEHYGEEEKSEQIGEVVEGEVTAPDPEIFYLEPEGPEISYTRRPVLKNGDVVKKEINAKKGENRDFWRKVDEILKGVNGKTAPLFSKRVRAGDMVYKEGEVFPSHPEDLIRHETMVL